MRYLTWHWVGFTRQQCADIAILTGHKCDCCPSLVRSVKQNAAVPPSEGSGEQGVVDVDLHQRLAQGLTTQHAVHLDLQVQSRIWGGGNKDQVKKRTGWLGQDN